jgi:hypothetical protein
MSENIYNIKILNPNEIMDLYLIIKYQIDNKFKKLITDNKKILVKYLLKVCVTCIFYFQLDNFLNQFLQNNCQDIFSLMNLLLPYYELNESHNMISLDELFRNANNNAKKLNSSYYIDHIQNKDDNDYLEKYFKNTLISIDNTLRKVSHKILPNWLNIFPYTIDNYKNINLYINFCQLRKDSSFKLDNYLVWDRIGNENDFIYNKDINNTHFLLGYDNLYGTIYKFLYMDIKDIKWLIYEVAYKEYTDIPIPNIVMLTNQLGINNIVNTKWENINKNEQSIIKNKWSELINNDKYIILVKSLIIYYLRIEYDEDNLKNITKKIKNKKCLYLINDIIKINDEQDVDEQDDINIYNNYNLMNECITQLSHIIEFEDIYEYVYKCMQQFKYTWYCSKCINNNKFYSINVFIENYKNNFFDKDSQITITLKNFYNFFKSILHFSNKQLNIYKLLSNSHSWDSLNIDYKKIFINRLNELHEQQYEDNYNKIFKWFNIINNLQRVYKKIDKQYIFIININIIEILCKSKFIENIIFETLIINGILSEFKYNPVVTDSKKLPDKNKNNDKWKDEIKKNINIEKYKKSYNFLSNTLLEETPEYYENVKKSMWYTNFGGDWIAQIQMYHHILNQRVLFITGATGAGKSTVAPFIILYGLKILNYDNNVKVMCTAPRIKPVEDNASRIADSLGVPIKENDVLIENKDIYYIQIQHQKQTKMKDDEYHPCLRFCTDGSLYNTINDNCLLKVKNNDTKSFLKKNIYNAILVDEAHEHNVYMDLMLTLLRYTTYINNQILLGIISATMDDDEITYRTYYKMIDDNWKWPLNVNYISTEHQNLLYNANLIDRRIHLSPPFLSTNFKITEFHEIVTVKPDEIKSTKVNNEIINVIGKILNTSNDGDILIFQNGKNEIDKLIIEINNKTPSSVIAIPFYADLDKNIMDNYIQKIHEPKIRDSITIPKNMSITELTIKNNEKLYKNRVEPGTYKRFIIVATNIAEASITINTLKFVIDIGTQKINKYNVNKDTEILVEDDISIPNQKQRRGRVGRVKPGFVYYMYDIKKLKPVVTFKICIQNITMELLNLLTSDTEYLINKNNDPYLVNDINIIPDFLKDQYSYNNKDTINVLYSNKPINNNIDNKITILEENNVIYPLRDGKYSIEMLYDYDGKFYIIHPNENEFIRDPYTLKITNLEELKKSKNYVNKSEKIFQLCKNKNIINDNILSKYGNLIIKLNNLLSLPNFNDISLILDIISFEKSLDTDIFKNILFYILFKNERSQNITIKKHTSLEDKADFLIIINNIPNDFFTKINIKKIVLNVLPDLSNLIILIEEEFKINKIEKYANIDNYKFIRSMLINYYIIKIKLFILFRFNLCIDMIINKLKLTNEFKCDNIKEEDNIKQQGGVVINKQINKKENNKQIKEYINTLDEVSTKCVELCCNNKKNKELNNILLLDNTSYNYNIMSKYRTLNNFEKITFLICKNNLYNILIKVPESNYYLEYFNRDINIIYKLGSYVSPYNKKINILTKVNTCYLNNIIFYTKIDESYNISSVIVIPNIILLLLKNILFKNNINNISYKNIKQDKEQMKKIYDNEYYNIYKKIDKIIEIINSKI